MGNNDLILWDKWEPFLPQLSKSYEIRYKQHFSILEEYPQHKPVGRRFYEQPWVIDGGALLYKRFLNDEKNVVHLVKRYGWGIIGKRIIPPPTFKDFIEQFFKGLMKFNTSSFNKLPMPAIQFTKRNPSGDCLKDNLFVRIGLDLPPSPEYWNLMLGDEDGVIDVPLHLFSHTYCNNRQPMNPVMFDHDFAHTVDNINNPELYEANQEFFQRICGTHPTKEKLFIAKDDPYAYNQYTLYGRICALHEELCLPNLDKKPEFAEFCDIYNRAPTMETKAALLVLQFPVFSKRHGGGMSDAYNLHNDLNIRTTAKQRYLRNTQLFQPKGRELFSQLALESMAGLASDIEYLLNSTNDTSHAKAQLFIKTKHLMNALKTGMELEITAGKFARETLEQFVDPNCDSAKWLSTFQDRHTSLTHKFYLSPAATNFEWFS